MKVKSFFLSKHLWRALMRVPASRKPDIVIGPPAKPYMLRWWIIPRNRVFNIYLHRFLQSDDARAMHDHPSANWSILLDGAYKEFFHDGTIKIRLPGDWIFRRPTTAHRIELFNRYDFDRATGNWIKDGPSPCWSLFITGPRVRNWGFKCPHGWVPWQHFTKSSNPGEVGPGCGD